MVTNLLTAITNLVNDPIIDLVSHYRFSNRINNMGDALEFYIRDLFCNSLHEDNLTRKNEVYNQHFSYMGNQNNPPDIMIKGGDAIEVKKIESLRSGIALNSSYPKDKIYRDSPMITTACRNCEDWKQKDLIYIIGVSNNGKLKALWFIYGNCYAANREIYARVSKGLTQGISNIKDIEFGITNELARVNKR